MTISMYQACVPVAIRMLQNLDACLGKSVDHAGQHDIDPDVLFRARLYPDMFPLSRQVQVACDVALRGATRLAGNPLLSIADDETDLVGLRARVRTTVELLEAFRPEQIDGSEGREISLDIRGNTMTFEGRVFLFHFVLPNLFFHVTTAYNILRHNGVPLGKGDFLGGR